MRAASEHHRGRRSSTEATIDTASHVFAGEKQPVAGRCRRRCKAQKCFIYGVESFSENCRETFLSVRIFGFDHKSYILISCVESMVDPSYGGLSCTAELYRRFW